MTSRKGKPFRTGERQAALVELFDTFAAKPPAYLAKRLDKLFEVLNSVAQRIGRPAVYRFRDFGYRTDIGAAIADRPDVVELK